MKCWQSLDLYRNAADFSQTEEVAMLLKIAQAASSSLSMNEVLTAISTAVLKATGACFCNAFLFPERSRCGYYYIIDPLPPADYQIPDPPDRFTLESLRTQQLLVADDVMSDPRTDKQTMKYFGIKSALAFPLIFEGKAVAAGFAWWCQPHHITDDEVELVKAIADASAVAVENARRHQADVQSAIVRERNRIAQEMHDTLAQSLAAIKLDLNCILRSSTLDATSAARITEAKDLTNQTYAELRDAIFSLRFAGDPHSEFQASFRRYVDHYGLQNGVNVCVELADKDVGLLSDEAKIQTSRILGEALSNIRQHAKAKNVWVTSQHDGQCVNILVEDDGVGIGADRPHTLKEGRFGLATMAERAADLGGSVEVVRRTPSGTRVHLRIPYR